MLQIGGLLSELLIFALSDQGLPLKIAVLALIDGDLRGGQVVDFGVEPDAALALWSKHREEPMGSHVTEAAEGKAGAGFYANDACIAVGSALIPTHSPLRPAISYVFI